MSDAANPTSTRARIGVLGAVFGLAFVVLAVHLWNVMVADHVTWSRRSVENRWAFHSVPARRGAIYDRSGALLAVDEATTELTLLYARFRLRHPVGAAVHGATKWAGCLPQQAGLVYDYGTGALGPADAVRDLLAMPAAVLRPRVLPRQLASELASATATVLAHCSGQTRARVFTALRQAAMADDGRCVGDVLAMPRADVLARFDRLWRELRELDARLLRSAATQPGRPLGADDRSGLIATLEALRPRSLAGERVRWEEPDPADPSKTVEKKGSKVEDVRVVFATRVPFDLAAELRVDARSQAGIDVQPTLARRRAVAEDSALAALLGVVDRIDRTVPSKEWLETLVDARLPDEWLTDVELPAELDADGGRERLVLASVDHYKREALLRERRGLSGIEREFNGTLTGRLGVRFAAHDSRRREQQLLEHLQVEAGGDVRLTLDLSLQRVAESAARTAHRRQAFGDALDRVRTEAALVVVDARTGDVLAYAGAPVSTPWARNLAGIEWIGNGSVGSLAKPFLLVEQLKAEAMGWTHRPLAGFEACNGRNCGGHAHWDGGKDPVEALAESCNSFYYQSGIGLGEDGVARALRRFGLAPAAAGDPYAACWQPAVAGIPAPAPVRDVERTALPQRAVGYGLQASPLHVARAYAGLATGWLPTLGVTPGARPRVPLDDVVGEVALVERGLRACVQTGTARRLRRLDELGVCGKTGTAEVGRGGENNAWFAGYLPPLGDEGVQMCFCAVVYWVQDAVHGGEAAGQLVVDFLAAVEQDPALRRRFLAEVGR
ncbi:MAG: penicillin-binding transpeptidase domain-containing protein [Planctomycetota bacterium]